MNLKRIFIIVTAIGIALAIYHAYDEIVSYDTSISRACGISPTISCAKVFSYSHPFGIPLYPFGLVWFPLILLVALYMRPRINRMLMLPLLMVGNMFTLYLWFLDIGIVWPAVHAVCPVCLSMYFVNYILTGLAIKAS
ncbi:MAG: vitamin K epoxide reductase family protein [Nitrososphaerales archaeon]